jgi:hypothetical protein
LWTSQRRQRGPGLAWKMPLLPADGQPPASKYLDWHRQKIFVA